MKLFARHFILLTALWCLGRLCPGASGEELAWGINAVTLAPACARHLALMNLALDANNSVSLGPFHRIGGANEAATPTECRVAFDADELLVVFRCTEKDMAFPALDHGVDWYSQLPKPGDQDASFPDKVDFYVSPDLQKGVCYQFAVTLDGKKFGVKRRAGPLQLSSDEEAETGGKFQRVRGFSAVVSKGQEEWTVRLQIPWRTMGGKPESAFGLIPFRTRWRQAEVSSPVAADFEDRPPMDLFIETHFPGAATMPASSGCLCVLPSGVQRWQRPALLTYPDRDTIQEIWQMEQSLSRPTTSANLAQRIQLTQRWTDLLELEGFCFRPYSGSITDERLSSALERGRVNMALRANDAGKASQLLDSYLGKLDLVSRRWFADGSPGNIRSDQWEPLTEINSADQEAGGAILHCLAGRRPVDLHLSFPEPGGIRLWANAEGYFKPAALRLAKVSDSLDSVLIAAPDARVIASKHPFALSFCDAAGNAIIRLGPHSIAFRFDAAGKVKAVDFRNHLDADEAIYGFGERFDHFNANGKVLTLWGVDAWAGNTAGLRNQSYKPVPVFHSSKGYSVFVNSSYRLRADLGMANPSEYRLSQHGPVFDYYFWLGPPERAIKSYTDLTGKPLLPPKWAFEPWMGRTGRGWSAGPLHSAVAEEKRVVKQFAENDIPHSAIYSEGTGADSWSLNKFMAGRGVKVLSWFFPVIESHTQSRLLPEIKEKELPILNVGENDSSNPINFVDFTNPNALELCRRWWKRRLDLGVAGSMVDFGDRTPESALFYDGQTGDEMHNRYSYDYQRTYHDVFAERRGDDFILFGRAAAPGTQKWTGQFPGDQPANFAGLRAVLTGALNLCACGFSTWGSDLGGFAGWPEPAVYMRWTQFACFSPLMRSHGRTPREPWEFGGAALSNYKHYAWVRENLLDYICAAAARAHQAGLPIMRSMAVAFPQELSLARVDDQYLFGDDLLVAPIVTESNTRTVCFPPGKWASLWDGGVINGPACVQLTAPLDTIPVFVKEGAAVPVRLGAHLQFGESMTASMVRALVITPPSEGEETSVDAASGAALRRTATGFVVKYKSLPEAQVLLLDGAGVTEIRLDGRRLSGWREDSVAGRVAVRLPPSVAGASATREIDIDTVGRHARR